MTKKVYGILLEQNALPDGITPSDFSRPGLTGISIWNSKSNDELAVIFESQEVPYRYQVAHRFSQLFFKTLAEAENYCLSHGFSKKQ